MKYVLLKDKMHYKAVDDAYKLKRFEEFIEIICFDDEI